MGTKSLSENYTDLPCTSFGSASDVSSCNLSVTPRWAEHSQWPLHRRCHEVSVLIETKKYNRNNHNSFAPKRSWRILVRYHTSLHRSLFFSVPKQGPFSRLLARTEPGTCAFIIFRSCICLFSFFERARERGECPVFAQQAKRAPFFFFVMAMLQLQENILRRILRSHLVPTCWDSKPVVGQLDAANTQIACLKHSSHLINPAKRSAHTCVLSHFCWDIRKWSQEIHLWLVREQKLRRQFPFNYPFFID